MNRGVEGIERPLRVAVVGAGSASDEEMELARTLGRLLGEAGAVVVTGGRGGVMEAASRGCVDAGGWTLGILPGSDASEANPWVRIPLASGFGEGRNVLVVRSAEAVLAVGGGWGTLSEIALARKMGRPVALLGRAPAPGVELPAFADPAPAVAWALERAVESRRERSPADPGVGPGSAPG